MTKLELTPERSEIISNAYAEWQEIGLSTQPADYDAAEAAVTALYASIGKDKPHFARFSSPLGAQLYINLLRKTWPDAPKDQLRGQLWDQLWDQLGDQLGGQIVQPGEYIITNNVEYDPWTQQARRVAD